MSPEMLTARLLQGIIARVAALQGGPASSITISHPANCGPYKQQLLAQAIAMADASATMLTEPEAAAISYAAN